MGQSPKVAILQGTPAAPETITAQGRAAQSIARALQGIG